MRLDHRLVHAQDAPASAETRDTHPGRKPSLLRAKWYETPKALLKLHCPGSLAQTRSPYHQQRYESRRSGPAPRLPNRLRHGCTASPRVGTE